MKFKFSDISIHIVYYYASKNTYFTPIFSSIPSDAGVYKVKFQNEQGEDETQAKIQVKAVSEF